MSLRRILGPSAFVSLLVAMGCGGGGATGAGGAGGAGNATSGHGGGGAGAPDKHIVVLFTSDEHSHLFAFAPELDDYPAATAQGSGALVGGVARRATVLAGLRDKATKDGKETILVSAGDNQMGTLVHAAFQTDSVDYGTMAALGYDVTTFGNHEFDFGPGALAASVTTAKANDAIPPIVASNIHFSSTDAGDDALAALYSTTVTDDKPVHPYRVVTKGKVKIGVLGYVGVNASHVAPNKTPVNFSQAALTDATKDGDLPTVLPLLYKDLQPVVDTLRTKEKVDIVIALAHGGVNDSSSKAGIDAGEDPQVCDNVSGIDFIVSGHAHNPDATPMQRTNKKTGKPCLVLNASSFGQHIGLVEFTIPGDPKKDVTWDKYTQALVPVSDLSLPDATEAAKTDGLLDTIEASQQGGSSFLVKLLNTALTPTTAITDDTAKHGDLYFFPVGSTTFDVTDRHALVALSADAMLKAADEWGAVQAPTPLTTEFSVESAGVIRQVLKKGKTGSISAADAFNVVPLGASPDPANGGTLGYPLVRAKLFLWEVREIFELALAYGSATSDYDLLPGGMQVEFDPTLPFGLTDPTDIFAVKPGRGKVRKMSIESVHGSENFDTVIFDASTTTTLTSLHSVVTSSYIAQFASDLNAIFTLQDEAGTKVTNLPDVIIHRSDNSEIKQFESFLRYVNAGWSATATTPPTALDARYDVTSGSATKRFVCVSNCPP